MVNNKHNNHLGKYDLSSDFQYGLRFSVSTTELLRVRSVIIFRAFDKCETTRAKNIFIKRIFIDNGKRK